jgi:dsRNA-specific ribonuclease
MARKDAAFQAYKALHVAGLVNDNLLPEREEASDEVASFQIPDITPSLVNASLPFDPWQEIATQQSKPSQAYHRILLRMKDRENVLHQVALLMPSPLPPVPKFDLHWSETKDFTIESALLSEAHLGDRELAVLRRITWKVLCSALHGKWTLEPRNDLIWLLSPVDPHGSPFDIDVLEQWDRDTDGQASPSALLEREPQDINKWGLARALGDLRPHFVGNIINESVAPMKIEDGEAYLQVIHFPRRRDFLHKIPPENINEAFSRVEPLNIRDCVVDRLPAIYSIFAVLVPSVIHKYEVCMTADKLRTTILGPMGFQQEDLGLIIQAMSPSKGGEDQDYQRLEFLGDCCLKLIASVHLMAAHALSAESYLTGKKGKIVCNGFLARATMAAGLDRFIITKRFTGKNWTPQFAGDILRAANQGEASESNNAKDLSKTTLCSSKLLADVIESLIGVSYLTGGFPRAFTCIQTLLPQEHWTPIPEANTILYENAPTDFTPTNFSTVERLLGHTFSKKLLILEALTHASYTATRTIVRSYERLEFLGDAVLDYIVSKQVYAHEPPLKHYTMHGIRSAMANATFLAFRSFETTVQEEVTNTHTLQRETVDRGLWQFLRYSDKGHRRFSSMANLLNKALAQYRMEREGILAAMKSGERYPWHLLARIDAPKFLSDIVESVIGAVYVDTQGDLAACEAVVRRFGILDALEDVLRRGVDCLHPKERLGHLAMEKTVEYVKVGGGEAEKGSEEGVTVVEEEEEVVGYTCQVRVGGVDVGGPVGGHKKLNAETIAAWRAVNILEGRWNWEDEAALAEGGVLLANR